MVVYKGDNALKMGTCLWAEHLTVYTHRVANTKSVTENLVLARSKPGLVGGHTASNTGFDHKRSLSFYLRLYTGAKVKHVDT